MKNSPYNFCKLLLFPRRNHKKVFVLQKSTNNTAKGLKRIKRN
jgi:hypothetical protein